MPRILLILILTSRTLFVISQDISEIFLSDSSLNHASVSLCIADAGNGEIILGHNSGKSLIPASILKLITSAAAIELLGPDYHFKTVLSYTGSLNKRSGILKGDIIIKGGGDPALGSVYFRDHYQDFMQQWVNEIKNLGIKKIKGRIISDDSYYDFQPVPSKWLWEDAGNYYGAGAYGLSAFDNTFAIHLKTGPEGSLPVVTAIEPEECRNELSNRLISLGTADKGYVFAAPYSSSGWIAGTIPVNTDDFVLKASVPDPPLMVAQMLHRRLDKSGVKIKGESATIRSLKVLPDSNTIQVAEIESPLLSNIIEVLNHESVNLFAEHLIKELGKHLNNEGSTISGKAAVMNFLSESGVKTDGMFIEDGSGLSPLNAIDASGMVSLLIYMKNQGKYFSEYFASLPDAGKEGTLKNYFHDPAFDTRLHAKSGSMTRVRSYAGYFTTMSGKEMVFTIIINNYTGPSRNVVGGIERIIKTVIESY